MKLTNSMARTVYPDALFDLLALQSFSAIAGFAFAGCFAVLNYTSSVPRAFHPVTNNRIWIAVGLPLYMISFLAFAVRFQIHRNTLTVSRTGDAPTWIVVIILRAIQSLSVITAVAKAKRLTCGR